MLCTKALFLLLLFNLSIAAKQATSVAGVSLVLTDANFNEKLQQYGTMLVQFYNPSMHFFFVFGNVNSQLVDIAEISRQNGK
jgi:hypothetical protein